MIALRFNSFGKSERIEYDVDDAAVVSALTDALMKGGHGVEALDVEQARRGYCKEHVLLSVMPDLDGEPLGKSSATSEDGVELEHLLIVDDVYSDPKEKRYLAFQKGGLRALRLSLEQAVRDGRLGAGTMTALDNGDLRLSVIKSLGPFDIGEFDGDPNSVEDADGILEKAGYNLAVRGNRSGDGSGPTTAQKATRDQTGRDNATRQEAAANTAIQYRSDGEDGLTNVAGFTLVSGRRGTTIRLTCPTDGSTIHRMPVEYSGDERCHNCGAHLIGVEIDVVTGEPVPKRTLARADRDTATGRRREQGGDATARDAQAQKSEYGDDDAGRLLAKGLAELERLVAWRERRRAMRASSL